MKSIDQNFFQPFNSTRSLTVAQIRSTIPSQLFPLKETFPFCRKLSLDTETTTESVCRSSEMVFHSGGADPPSCESFGAKFIPVGRPKSLNLLLRSYFGPYRIPTVNEIRWDHVPMRSIVSPYGWYRLPRL